MHQNIPRLKKQLRSGWRVLSKTMTDISLDNVSETALITLWSKAVENDRKCPIIKDKKDLEMMKSINYDFSKFKNSWKSQVGVCIRAKIIDDVVSLFLKKHLNCVVVNLGAGLDSRFFRVDNGIVLWYDLDLPEMISVKKNFMEENQRYKMISKSIFDDSWIEEVNKHNLPILLIAEGLLMYFEKKDVNKLFDTFIEKFVQTEFIFDVIHTSLIKHSDKHDSVKTMNTKFKWGLASREELLAINKKLKLKDEWSLFDYHKDRWRWIRYITMIPKIKRLLCGCIYQIKW